MFYKDDGDYQYEECTYVLSKYGKKLIMIRYNWNTYARARCNCNIFLNVMYIWKTIVTGMHECIYVYFFKQFVQKLIQNFNFNNVNNSI